MITYIYLMIHLWYRNHNLALVKYVETKLGAAYMCICGKYFPL